MTTDLIDLHPTNDRSSSKPTWRFWVSLAASGMLIGALYATWTHPGGAPEPEPPSKQVSAAAVAAHDDEASGAEGEAPEPAASEIGAETAIAKAERLVEAAGEVVENEEGGGAAHSEQEVESENSLSAPEAVEYATDGNYYVQVASYRTKEHADSDARRLSDRGLPAQSRAYGGPSAGWWHTVRLGPFETRPEAEAARFKLRRGERLGAYVLPRSNGKYHVQVASLSSPDKAERIAERFAEQGHATKVSRVTMGGKQWYCVRIGPFDTRGEAVGYKKLVDDVAGTESTVIPFAPAK